MPVGMPGGCGVRGGLAVLAGDVGAVRVPAWVAVLLAVAGGAAVAAVCLRERMLGPALLAAEAAVPWVLAVSCCRELLVAIAGAPVGTAGLLPWLVEDTESVVVFLTAVPEGMAVPGLSAGVVGSLPAPAWAVACWSGAAVAWSCSIVCSAVLWLVAVV